MFIDRLMRKTSGSSPSEYWAAAGKKCAEGWQRSVADAEYKASGVDPYYNLLTTIVLPEYRVTLCVWPYAGEDGRKRVNEYAILQ